MPRKAFKYRLYPTRKQEQLLFWTLTRCRQLYAIFSCEVEQPAPLPGVSSEVGIDLGVTHFAALSDGPFIESLRFLRKAQADLKRKPRHLSRCKRGSHRRERARKAVAKAHRKVRNQRRDFHHNSEGANVSPHCVHRWGHT